MKRIYPNLLITGTPGTGKTQLCERIIDQLPDDLKSEFTIMNLSDFAKTNKCLDGYDYELECDIIDEEVVEQKLIEKFDPSGGGDGEGPDSARPRHGGIIMDYHGADLIPKQLLDKVFVLRCNNSILYDRLSKRNYPQKKIEMNLECEIFQSIKDEAIDAFGPEMVIEMNSEDENDCESNIQEIIKWIYKWMNYQEKKEGAKVNGDEARVKSKSHEGNVYNEASVNHEGKLDAKQNGDEDVEDERRINGDDEGSDDEGRTDGKRLNGDEFGSEIEKRLKTK